jgi:hypothetical protein
MELRDTTAESGAVFIIQKYNIKNLNVKIQLGVERWMLKKYA